MPAAGNFGQALTDAVRQGKVSTDVIDDKVLRLLTEEFAYGLFERTPGSPDATATSAEHVKTARDIAAEGTALMTNDARHGAALLPPRRLKAFKKVTLRPGEALRIDLTVPADQLRIWDGAAHGWTSPVGTARVEVGNSGANLPLKRSWRMGRSR